MCRSLHAPIRLDTRAGARLSHPWWLGATPLSILASPQRGNHRCTDVHLGTSIVTVSVCVSLLSVVEGVDGIPCRGGSMAARDHTTHRNAPQHATTQHATQQHTATHGSSQRHTTAARFSYDPYDPPTIPPMIPPTIRPAIPCKNTVGSTFCCELKRFLNLPNLF